MAPRNSLKGQERCFRPAPHLSQVGVHCTCYGMPQGCLSWGTLPYECMSVGDGYHNGTLSIVFNPFRRARNRNIAVKPSLTTRTFSPLKKGQ